VKEGDLLIELDPTITQAEVESSERSLTINRYEMARLKAELEGEEIEGSEETTSGYSDFKKILNRQENLNIRPE